MHRLPKPAGATACEAAELRRALSVNPHDLDRVEEAVRRDCISAPTLPGRPRWVLLIEGGPASPIGCLSAAYAALFGVEPWIGRISRNDE
jgi:hypothetical protein